MISILKYVFNRIEKKYLLNKEEYDYLLERIEDKMIVDTYGEYSILNIYFDSKQYDLIRISNDKPEYKEKIRLRSYGVPTLDHKVFLEIKKKYREIVNKRRISFSLSDYYLFSKKGFNHANQIQKEIIYDFEKYQLEPKVFVAYDRMAFQGKDDFEFRLTFDKNLRYRLEDLRLELGDAGKKYFDQDMYILEVKCMGAMPLWFTRILSEKKIYPISFSKIGNIYKKIMGKEEEHYV